MGYKTRELYYLLSKSYIFIERFSKAVSTLEEALKEGFEDKEFLLLLSLSYIRTGNAGRAVAILEDLSHKDPQNVDLLKQLAKLYQRQGRFGDAEACWKNVLELKPGDKESLEALSKLSRTSSAISEPKFRPEHVEAHRLLARGYMKRGMIEEALLEWRKVLKVFPEDAEALEAVEKLGGRDRGDVS